MSGIVRRCAGFVLSLAAGGVLAAPAERPGGGDARNGEVLYGRCAACHSLAYDRTGPRHCGLFDRRAGTVRGFQYSAAMKQSAIVWSRASLDRFLANPLKAVPGTSMGYAGVADPKERGDLIAYLRAAGSSEECKKSR